MAVQENTIRKGKRHSVSLGTDSPSILQPRTFLCPQALENLTSATVRQKALIIPIWCIVYICLPRTGPVTPEAEGRPGQGSAMPPLSPLFWVRKKKKKGYKGKRKSFKAETIKKTVIKIKLFLFYSHSRASRIQNIFLYCRPNIQMQWKNQ